MLQVPPEDGDYVAFLLRKMKNKSRKMHLPVSHTNPVCAEALPLVQPRCFPARFRNLRCGPEEHAGHPGNPRPLRFISAVSVI